MLSTRERILVAARRAFDEAGEAGLSLRDVAGRARLTPMALYRHFENKQAIVDALMMEAIAEWRRRAAAIRPGAPVAWLLRITDAYLDFALSEPRKYEAAFLVSSPRALRYPDDFLSGGSPAVSVQLQIIKDALGADSKTSPTDVLIIVTALAQGLIVMYRAGRIVGDEKRFRTLYRRELKRCVLSFIGPRR
jgi:AcrR family transcriptional regulator